MAISSTRLLIAALTVTGFSVATISFAQSRFEYEYSAPLHCNPHSAKTSDTTFQILNDSQKTDNIKIVHMLDQWEGNQTFSGDNEVKGQQSITVSCRDIMDVHKQLSAGATRDGFRGFTRISSNTPLSIIATYTIDATYAKAIDVYPVPQTKGPEARTTPNEQGWEIKKLENWTTCDPNGTFSSDRALSPIFSSATGGPSTPISTYNKDRTLHIDPFSRSPATRGPGVPVIVGGQLVNFKSEYPWMAHLDVELKDRQSITYNFNCGATLISDQWLMTAAHCIYVPYFEAKYKNNVKNSFDLSKINVGLGGLDVRGLERHKATETLCHKDYNSATLENDIALIKLDRPVTMQQGAISIANLPSSSQRDGVFVRGVSYPTGWGTSDNDRLSAKLLKIRLDTTSVSDSRFEAKKDSNYGSVCFGDSGGPTHNQNGEGVNASKEVVGISSYVQRGPNATPEDPGCRFYGVTSGFTRVSHYVDHINEATNLCSGNNSSCFE